MKSFLRNVRIFTLVFAMLSLSLLAGLVIQQQRSRDRLWAAAGENKAALRAYYRLAGDILTRDEVILATSQDGNRRYAQDPLLAQACLQIVGDYTHIMGNTIEAAYQGELLGSSRNPLRQLLLDITGEGIRGDSLQLTLDSELTKTAYQGLGQYRGSAILMNYKTGEILAMASTPSTSPDHVIRYTDIPDTALLNRSINGLYPPGSTFKLVTASAFQQSPVYREDFTVDCTGQALLPNGTREIYGHGHGTVNLSQAFAQSCNLFFGEAGRRVGLEALQKEAEAFGWNREMQLDRLRVSKPVFYCPPQDEAILSWAAIGQPVGEVDIRLTPLQLVLEAATIANRGECPGAHILRKIIDPRGRSREELKQTAFRRVLPENIAEADGELMKEAVRSGLVQALARWDKVVAAKSGTAEVEGKQATGLIMAYLDDETHPLAVAVVMEDMGAGAGKPLYLASALFDQAIQRYPQGFSPEIEENQPSIRENDGERSSVRS